MAEHTDARRDRWARSIVPQLVVVAAAVVLVVLAAVLS
jgi:hypothetical protein